MNLLHKDLIDSGLAALFSMNPVVDADDPRAPWLGQRVRYKRGLDWAKLGTIARDSIFIVGGVQTNWRGDPCLRIYSEDEVAALSGDKPWRCFGRVGNVDELELVK